MAFAAHAEWKRLTGSNCVIKVGHGRDGADDALLHTCDPLRIVERYGRVVVGSGDHKFADLVLDLRDHGTLIGLVSRESGLSHTLACTTPIRHVVDLPALEVPKADRPTMPTPRRQPRRTSARRSRRPRSIGHEPG
jgi:hypothetical protein